MFCLFLALQTVDLEDIAALMSNVTIPQSQQTAYIDTQAHFARDDQQRLILETVETYRTTGEPESNAMVERRKIPVDRIAQFEILVGQAVAEGREFYLLISYLVDDKQPSSTYQFEGEANTMSVLRSVRIGTFTAEEAAILDIEMPLLIEKEQAKP